MSGELAVEIAHQAPLIIAAVGSTFAAILAGWNRGAIKQAAVKADAAAVDAALTVAAVNHVAPGHPTISDRVDNLGAAIGDVHIRLLSGERRGLKLESKLEVIDGKLDAHAALHGNTHTPPDDTENP